MHRRPDANELRRHDTKRMSLRNRLFALVQDRPALQLQWFQFVPPMEARAQFNTIFAAADRFTSAQRATFQKRAAEIGVSSTPP